jgi:hypothetical protein
MARQIAKTIAHYSPELRSWLDGLKDTRRRNVGYSVGEVTMAGIALFVLMQGSRNEMNLSRSSPAFVEGYRRVFGAGLPSMDVVEDLFRKLGTGGIEKVKLMMVRALMDKKVFSRHKVPGGGIVVAVDGTGISTYDHDPGGTTSRTYKSGRTCYFHYVLEAKIVTSSGLSISIATVWVENVGKDHDKQDCEQKAFVRLAAKLKESFPRLRICIAADGLYPNATFFGICRANRWDYIVTLRDGSLSSVWEELGLRPKDPQQTREILARVRQTRTYRWVTAIDYGVHSLNWVECVEQTVMKDGKVRKCRFVHVTNLPLDRKTAPQVSGAGRLRWKIENEGFRAQKHEGYNLGHKFSRVSFNATKNYYQCLQIAHMINQLAIHSTTIQEEINRPGKLTIKHLWKLMLQALNTAGHDHQDLRPDPGRCQIRLA